MSVAIWHVIVTAIGVLLIPVITAVARITKSQTKHEIKMIEMEVKIREIDREVEIQKSKTSDLKTDIALIKKDMTYTREKIDELGGVMKEIIKRIDNAINKP